MSDKDKFHNLGGAVDLRSFQQPQPQALITTNPDGSRSQFPFVAVAFISDAGLQNIASAVTATIFAELERRGIIAPQTPPEQPAQPAPTETEGSADAHQPE